MQGQLKPVALWKTIKKINPAESLQGEKPISGHAGTSWCRRGLGLNVLVKGRNRSKRLTTISTEKFTAQIMPTFNLYLPESRGCGCVPDSRRVAQSLLAALRKPRGEITFSCRPNYQQNKWGNHKQTSLPEASAECRPTPCQVPQPRAGRPHCKGKERMQQRHLDTHQVAQINSLDVTYLTGVAISETTAPNCLDMEMHSDSGPHRRHGSQTTTTIIIIHSKNDSTLEQQPPALITCRWAQLSYQGARISFPPTWQEEKNIMLCTEHTYEWLRDQIQPLCTSCWYFAPRLYTFF